MAEGHGRSSSKHDYAHFLAISKGSLMETKTLLMLTIKLNYLSSEEANSTLSLITEISKMLTTLRHRILKS
ncbi:four helix bundle protein [Nostoc sp. FACHB-280]|uniref:four helix bundle protein n=1 Tax=Nostoc sp. FACHB-280 TaxID=2692839 RepID=UPI0028C4E1E2|nr:four helix bundle protein [Nostoc sp. FACHB-280]